MFGSLVSIIVYCAFICPDLSFLIEGNYKALISFDLFKLQLMFILMIGLAIYVLISKSKHYKATEVEIATGIKTPSKAGQGQHGTSKWLSKKEYDKKYAYVKLDDDLINNIKLLKKNH